MPRKKNTSTPTIIHIKLTLYQFRDDDLIEFFQSIPTYKRSQMVKSAMRGGNITPVSVEDENIDELMNDLFI